MKENLVFRNYLIPMFPKKVHQLRTYLHSRQQYQNYSEEQIKVVIKNIKADKYVLKKLKTEMQEHQRIVEGKQQKYFKRFIAPLYKIPTFQESLYQEACKSFQEKHSIKQIYSLIKAIHPKTKRSIWQYVQQANQDLWKNKLYFRQRYIPTLYADSIEEYYHSLFPYQLKKYSLNGSKQGKESLIWDQLDQQNRELFIKDFGNILRHHQESMNALCITHQIEQNKLSKLVQKQYTNQQKIHQELQHLMHKKSQ